MISDFFAKICCKHLTKRLNFATILVACGRGSFFCAPFLRKISFAILCRACVFPRLFTQSKLPSGKPRAPRLARNFSAKAKEEDSLRNTMSRLRFPSVIYALVNSRRESRALLVLLGTFPQKPRKKISFAIPCRAYYIYRYGASAGQTMFLISVFYGLRIFRNLTRR